MSDLVGELREVGRSAGLDHVGFCSATPFDETRVDLEERKGRDLHAGMQFTYRNPFRSTTPTEALPGARSLVVAARSYRRVDTHAVGAAPSAAVAEYVWEPHYDRLRDGLSAVAERLREHGHRTRVVADDNALVDRAAAYRAGIGWYGKNSNILVPNEGSRFVLGSVITTAQLLGTDPEPVADQCGSCRRCIDNCPTDAIVDDGVIDSNRCLAWLVQAEGVFPRQFRRALGNRLYGCDDCQTTCPPNVLADRHDPPIGTSGTTTVDVLALLNMTDQELLDRFGAWYIPRREARYLRRNALVVLGNIGDPGDRAIASAVRRFCASDDPIERAHALWAAHELGYHDLVAECADDPDEIVVAELAHLVRPA